MSRSPRVNSPEAKGPRVASPSFNVTSVKVQWPHREWLSSLKADDGLKGDDFTTFNFPSRLSSFSSLPSSSSHTPHTTHHTSLLEDTPHPTLFEDATSSATSSEPIVEASSLWIALGFSIAAVVLVLLLVGGFFLVRHYKKKRLSP